MNINLTLIGQLLTFVVFVWFTKRYVWTPIIAALEERKAKIADGLAAGERGVHEQELAKNRAIEEIRKAKGQAAEIVNMAQKRAAEIVDEAKENAHTEGERILTTARSEIEQESNSAREALRGQVAELAVAGAEKILRREVNADAHGEIIDALAKQL
ncbi:MAG: F0F1 ATP synthase subunit B [Pseudomonadota bacterium]